MPLTVSQLAERARISSDAVRAEEATTSLVSKDLSDDAKAGCGCCRAPTAPTREDEIHELQARMAAVQRRLRNVGPEVASHRTERSCTMKLGIVGKGGTGKTTLAALISTAYVDMGRRVVAVDTDSDPNLALSLGLDEAVADQAPLVVAADREGRMLERPSEGVRRAVGEIISFVDSPQLQHEALERERQRLERRLGELTQPA